MNYEQIRQQEIAALEAAIKTQSALITGLEANLNGAGWGATRKITARVEFAKEQLQLLQQTLDRLEQPLHAPATFVQADKSVFALMSRSRLPPTYKEQKAKERLIQLADDPSMPDYAEKCRNLNLCRDAINACIYQKTRTKLVSEFLDAAHSWDAVKLKAERDRREDEERHTRRLDKRRLKVFTTEDLEIQEDPADFAGPFLRDLVSQLRMLLEQRILLEQKPSSIDPFIEEVGRKAVEAVAADMTTMNARDRLVAKCDELKKILPSGYHRGLDEYFRRQIDVVLRGEGPK